jgi:hypothetical protein
MADFGYIFSYERKIPMGSLAGRFYSGAEGKGVHIL